MVSKREDQNGVLIMEEDLKYIKCTYCPTPDKARGNI